MSATGSKFFILQKANELALHIFSITKEIPQEEHFSLALQMRRAAVSIPCNIVEGKSQGPGREFIRLLVIARGSLKELKYQLLLAKNLNLIYNDSYNKTISLADHVGRLLNGLLNTMDRKVS